MKILRIVQRDATQSSLFIILQVHSTCFGCQPHPSSGVHRTVTTVSGTVQLPPSKVAKLGLGGSCTKHTTSTGGCSYSFVCSWWWVWCGTAATSLHGQAWPCWREVAAQKLWPVPEAVVTVLCTLDDGCGWHPKHVEWTCRIINRLLCVASRWTVMNIDQRCTEP